MAVARNIKQATGGVRGGMLQGNGRVIQGNAPYGPASKLQGSNTPKWKGLSIKGKLKKAANKMFGL